MISSNSDVRQDDLAILRSVEAYCGQMMSGAHDSNGDVVEFDASWFSEVFHNMHHLAGAVRRLVEVEATS